MNDCDSTFGLDDDLILRERACDDLEIPAIERVPRDQLAEQLFLEL